MRIDGLVEHVSGEEAEQYFHSRPVASQIGAWVSHQSSVISCRAELDERQAEYWQKFSGKPVPMPDYWGGYRVVPNMLEFWQGRPKPIARSAAIQSHWRAVENREAVPLNAGNADDGELRRKLILISALPFRIDRSHVTANSFRILRHALTCAGLWTGQMADGSFEAVDPVFESWYSTLIEMTRPTADGQQLMEGHGNLVTPAGARFTACFLTDHGRNLAEKIAGEHPQWRPAERRNS